MFDVSVRTSFKEVERSLSSLARQQLPFAKAMAVTGLARRVQEAEQSAFGQVFDRPAPFTVKSVGVRAARKNDPTAVVFVKDIAAAYLEPFEFGGAHKTNGRALLNPKGAQTNQYGNLPRNLVARLKSRADIFIGAIKTKSGEVVNGVWQRPAAAPAMAGRRTPRGANHTGQLKLLVRFTDPEPVTQHLDYRARAKRVIAAQFNAEFSSAMTKALASARL